MIMPVFRRSERLRPLGRARALCEPLLVVLFASSVMAGLATCGSPHALLLRLDAEERVVKVQVRVTDLASGTLFWELVEQEPGRDISQPGQALRVGGPLDEPGSYLVQVLGRGVSGNLFVARAIEVDGVVEQSLTLRRVSTALDADKDGVPACGKGDDYCEGQACLYLDCDDKKATVNPFAKEICGDSLDNDCSAGCDAAAGQGDAECVDMDKDGDPSSTDCDDNDPCRSSKHRELRNLCKAASCDGQVLSSSEQPTLNAACLAQLAAAGKTASAPFCGDGVDQDCSGQDQSCQIDKDCDCYTASDDCDDSRKDVNKGQKEVCGDGIDNNCDGSKDEGCLPCDVDGDGHAAKGSTDTACAKLPADDPDDYDRGIHPKTTQAEAAGAEGGTAKGALRGWCSHTRLAKNSTASIKLLERDVDHDGDGKPASQDGCPSKSCDADGDGFQVQACNPPLSQMDCDDTDAKVFPGAPDRCNDGKAWNCQSDKTCVSPVDADGDLYDAKDDCDDTRSDIHPWTTELCDGIDNDCDGLIDEGNPDTNGLLMGTLVKSCSDDNDGLCAPTCTPGTPGCVLVPGVGSRYVLMSGICACSGQTPSGKRDENDRVKCSGEDLKKSPSARCFGATQPMPEECDTKDHDCDEKLDDPKGVNFKDKGLACGLTATANGASCKAGTVTGCDLSQVMANADTADKVLKSKGLPFHKNWVCSSDTLLPLTEVCNGRDDDCDGTVPSGETDADGDKYLSCTSCSGLSGRTALAAGLLGCSDCDDTGTFAASTHPGASEYCNGRDDNCSSGVTDDGKDECASMGSTYSCCTTQKACRDLQNDLTNCGTCGKSCDSSVSNGCKAGQCTCGSVSACASGLNCQGSQCQCLTGSTSRCAAGCCDGTTTCRLAGSGGNQSSSKCGTGGQTCVSCDDSNTCTDDLCTSSGTCSNQAVSSSPPKTCATGLCVGGSCCSGCSSGGSCLTGTSASACGKNGQACKTCNYADACEIDICTSSGTCTTQDAANGTTCSDGKYCTTTDACQNGSCKGKARDCSTLDDDCNVGQCSETAQACQKLPKANGTSCNSGTGKCQNGLCCTGCWDGSACKTGTSTSACGTGGGSCIVCTAPTSGCASTTCTSGICGTVLLADGTACTYGGSAGKCFTDALGKSACCTTCWDSINKTCQASDGAPYCGLGGAACTSCLGGTCDSSGTCTCTGCWAPSGPPICYKGTSSLNCGENGDPCKDCMKTGMTCVSQTCQ